MPPPQHHFGLTCVPLFASSNSARVPEISNPNLDNFPGPEEPPEPSDDLAIPSTVGSTLVHIFTHVGTLTLDGTSISYDEDGGRGLTEVFAHAAIGFKVEGTR